jgi:hypothetical protein
VKRRTVEEKVADLEAQIVAVKAREAKRKARRDPAVSEALKAIKSVDKALGATQDAPMRTALHEARGTLAACVAVTGLVVPESTTAAPAAKRGRPRKTAA